MEHVISVLVKNRFGVLAHIAGMFSGRGFNIDSLAVGKTLDPTVSRTRVPLALMTFLVCFGSANAQKVPPEIKRAEERQAQEEVQKKVQDIIQVNRIVDEVQREDEKTSAGTSSRAPLMAAATGRRVRFMWKTQSSTSIHKNRGPVVNVESPSEKVTSPGGFDSINLEHLTKAGATPEQVESLRQLNKEIWEACITIKDKPSEEEKTRIASLLDKQASILSPQQRESYHELRRQTMEKLSIQSPLTRGRSFIGQTSVPLRRQSAP